MKDLSALAMDTSRRGSKTKRFRWWFSRKKKRADPFNDNDFREVSDEGEEDEYIDSRSLEMDPCIDTDELRVFVGTWNVAGRSPAGSLTVDLDEWLNLKDSADIYVLGFQEIVPLKASTVIGGEDQTEATNWNLIIGRTLNDKYGCPWLTPMINPINSENYNFKGKSEPKRQHISMKSQPEQSTRCSRYKLIASKKMVGVFISIWIRSALLKRYKISEVRVCSVACGIMGYLGNKGSVSISMSIGGTSFCFVVAHLASGEKKGDEGKRNHQVTEIFRRTSFPRLRHGGNSPIPLNILGHDRIFWFGDLNYRLYLEDNLARELIKKKDWRALQKFDQLGKELDGGGVFQGWREGNVEFAPTYKYSSGNCDRYSGGVPSRVGEKQRTPAWCDRILWYGKGIKQISYFRSESKFSDHRPVSALFSTKIPVLKCANRMAVAPEPVISGGIPSKTGQEKMDEEAITTLQSLIETLPSNRQLKE